MSTAATSKVAQLPGVITQVCTGECGEEKAIGEFGIHGRTLQPYKMCSKCRGEKISRGRKKHFQEKTTTPNRITGSKKFDKPSGSITKEEQKLLLHFLLQTDGMTSNELGFVTQIPTRRCGAALRSLQGKEIVEKKSYNLINLDGETITMNRWNISESFRAFAEFSS